MGTVPLPIIGHMQRGRASLLPSVMVLAVSEALRKRCKACRWFSACQRSFILCASVMHRPCLDAGVHMNMGVIMHANMMVIHEIQMTLPLANSSLAHACVRLTSARMCPQCDAGAARPGPGKPGGSGFQLLHHNRLILPLRNHERCWGEDPARRHHLR